MIFLNRNKRYKSKINGSIHIGKRSENKALFSGGVTQSGGELIQMWKSVSKRIKKEYPTAKICLVLGVAGGTFISSILKPFPKMEITGIELDKTMIDIYLSNFKEDKIKIKLINDDAIKWIKNNSFKYDVILVDLYIGRHNPLKARKRIFLMNILKNLNKKGIIIYNSHFDINNKEEFEKFKKLTETFYNTQIIYEFPLNRVLLLTQRESISKDLKNKL